MNKDIIFLNPVCTHNIWGGTRLNREFGYPIEGDDIGECWGISAHPNGDGTVFHSAVSIGMGADAPALTDVVALDGVTELSVQPGAAPDVVGAYRL